MVLSNEPAGRRALAQSRTLPLTSITRTESTTEPETRRRSSTLPYNISGDVPIFSRNIPSAFSVAASYCSDREEISFSNSILYLEEDNKLPRTLSPANLETDLVVSPSQVHFKVPFHHPGQPGLTAGAGGSSLLDGIWGCFKPMWAIMGKNKPINMERGETPHHSRPHHTGPHHIAHHTTHEHTTPHSYHCT